MPGRVKGTPRSDDGFARECQSVLRAVRAGARQLIAASPTKVLRATDLQVALGIRASLAWQVFRLARAQAPLETVTHIPLPEAMRKVFVAARRAGFDPAAVESAAGAYADFTEFAARHAEDRQTFDAMALALTEASPADLRSRRAAFRANAMFWGLQSRITYRCLIGGVHEPGHEPLSTIIQGSLGVRALRPRRDLPICRRTVTVTRSDDDDEVSPAHVAVGVLEDFCSSNLPPIRTKYRGAVAHDFITLDGIGRTSMADVFVASQLRFALEPEEPDMGVTSMVRTPTEEFIADLLAPAGVLDPSQALARAYGCLEDVSAAENAGREHALPGTLPAEYLGTNIDALHDPDFPRCPELIRFVLRDMGTSRVTYDIFRCRVPFPMLHACIGLNVARRTRRRTR